METMKEIAVAYYERASEEEKKLAREFFKNVDQNGDGKISLMALRDSARRKGSKLLYDKVFKQLDSNCDGTLDFNEVLALYMANKLGDFSCNGCNNLLAGSFFSCFLRLSEFPKTFNLCCDCYRNGKFMHKHSTSNFLDSNSLVKLFMEHLANEQKTRWKGNGSKTSNLCCECNGDGNFEHEHSSNFLDDHPILMHFWNHLEKEQKTSRKKEMEELRLAEEQKTSRKEERKELRLAEKQKTSGNVQKEMKELRLVEEQKTSGKKEMKELRLAEEQKTSEKKEMKELRLAEEQKTSEKKEMKELRLAEEQKTSGKKEMKELRMAEEQKTSEKLRLAKEQKTSGKKEIKELRLAEEQKTSGKKGMEELREIAKSHYRASSPELQALAREFFNAMDSDDDGQIDLPEFLSFTRQKGHYQMQNPYFFKELDRDENGTLDFWEVMTLYYIIKSGRPFCDFCGIFIPGIFFSCVECYKNPQSSYTLCCNCYRSTKCNHNHDGRTQFLDNYTLLEAYRDSSPPVRIDHYKRNSSTVPNPSTAIIPASKGDKWKAALKVFEAAIAVGNILATACTIL